MKTTITFFLTCFLFVCANAQTKFTETDKAFFAAQTEEMRAFLENKGITDIKYLDIALIENKKGKPFVALRMEMPDPDTWLNLRNSYRAQFDISLEKDVFDKLVFLCEIDAADALVSVYAQDKTGKYEMIAHLNPDKNFVFEIDESKNKALVTKNIKLPSYALSKSQKLDNDALLKNINKKVVDILKKYYKDKGAWWQDAKFEVVSDYPDDLRIKVSNIKREVFNETFYFELIFITLSFQKNTDGHHYFVCSVDAKYGTTILFAPRSSEYKPVSSSS